MAVNIAHCSMYVECLLRLHEATLKEIGQGSFDAFPSVSDISSQIRALGLNSLLNMVSYTALKNHLFIKSQEIVQETGQSILEDVHAYMNTTLEKYFETTVRMQRLMMKLFSMVH